jgi:ATP-dependent DNA helicase RecQ
LSSEAELANQYVRSLDGRLKKEPLESENDSPGIVELTWCESPYLYEPIVNKILKTKSSGTSCVLTSTNEQALQIASLLQQKGLQAKLIQSNEKLKLGNLVEVRNFMDLLINTGTKILVQQDDWQKSVEIFKEKNSNSANFKAVERLIEDFQKTCGSRIFLSDFKEFVNESRLEDFIAPDESEILVSTIHKAKGKEFDTVYLMLQDFKFDTQEKRRQLYVALTRAKTRLFLITNNADLQLIIGEEFQWKLDNTNYQQPRELILNAGFKDIYLDSFKEFQNYIDGTLAGSSLIVHSKGCNNEKGQPCVRYSKSFIKKLEDLSQKGFQPEKAEAAYVFWWQKQTGKKENEEYPEIKVILPRLYLRLVL